MRVKKEEVAHVLSKLDLYAFVVVVVVEGGRYASKSRMARRKPQSKTSCMEGARALTT